MPHAIFFNTRYVFMADLVDPLRNFGLQIFPGTFSTDRRNSYLDRKSVM